MTLSVEITRLRHQADNVDRFGADNLWGRAVFSDGKAYRFRYATITSPPGKYGETRDTENGEHVFTVWTKFGPDQDPRSDERVVPLGAERLDLIREAVMPMMAEAKRSGREDAAQKAQEKAIRDSRALAYRLERDAAHDLVATVREALDRLKDAEDRTEAADPDTAAQLRKLRLDLQTHINRADGITPQIAYQVRRRDDGTGKPGSWAKWTFAWSEEGATVEHAFTGGAGLLPEDFEAEPDPEYGKTGNR